MIKSTIKNMIVFCAFATLAACSQPQDEAQHKAGPRQSKPTVFFGQQGEAFNTVTVQNIQGARISGVEILIGYGVDDPFVGNFLRANENGEVIIPTGWANLPVTISAPGYIRSTYFNQSASDLSYTLRPLDPTVRFELSGVTTGYGSLPKDDTADFGIVIPTLSRGDVFSFDMNMVVSPFMDSFEIAGQAAEVPSNITFPKQKESYIIPINLEKEKYRMFLDGAGVKRVVAIRGQFPFKDVVKLMRKGAEFPQLMNYFSFVSAGIRDLEVTSDKVINLPVNEIPFGNPREFVAPTAGKGQIVVGFSLSELSGYYVPADFKRLTSGKISKLKTSQNGQAWLLNILKREVDFNSTNPPSRALSVSLLPFQPKVSTQFIPLFEKPKVGFEGWAITQPAANGNLIPMATYSVMSQVINTNRGELRARSWEVYQEGWMNDLKLPAWPGETSPSGKFRWEVSYLGNESQKVFKLGPQLLESVSHASYNANDF